MEKDTKEKATKLDETGGTPVEIERLVMDAFNFTEKDRAKLYKAQKAITKASSTAATALRNFGIAAEIMKDKTGLKAQP